VSACPFCGADVSETDLGDITEVVCPDCHAYIDDDGEWQETPPLMLDPNAPEPELDL
jgi:hypothetical protein